MRRLWMSTHEMLTKSCWRALQIVRPRGEYVNSGRLRHHQGLPSQVRHEVFCQSASNYCTRNDSRNGDFARQ